MRGKRKEEKDKRNTETQDSRNIAGSCGKENLELRARRTITNSYLVFFALN